MAASVTVWAIALAVVAGMLLRPWRSHEWQWALGGAIAVVALRGETPAAAWGAIAGGTSVYAFLAGIAIIAELARSGGVFAALAARARAAAGRSRGRLFLLVFGAGAIVTVLLSNDTTALVLTPAVFVALDASGVDPLPYLYACAFVANAASFVLPISNPANLVMFNGRPPALADWFCSFGLAASGAILATYGLLWLIFRVRFRKPLPAGYPAPPLPARTRITGLAVAACAVGMVVAAGLGWNLGVAALLLSLGAAAALAVIDRTILVPVAGKLPWQIFPLVAGLFVVVDALDRAGVLAPANGLLARAAALPATLGGVAAAFGTAAASNAFNNLPVAMAVAHGAALPHAARVFHAAVVGVDLGPNLSVTGSLSTLLWLIAVRREGLEISAGSFLLTGLRAGLPVLFIAGLLVR